MLFDLHHPFEITGYEHLLPKKTDFIVLGGDIIDMKYLFGWQRKRASEFDPEQYENDIKWLRNYIIRLKKISDTIFFFEGNHEQRLTGWVKKYPCWRKYNIRADIKDLVKKYIPYGTHSSYLKMGDALIMHGHYWNEHHGKKIFYSYGVKVIYGHLHSYEIYCPRTFIGLKYSRFALSCPCLCSKAPDWKYTPNRWTNGFTTCIINKGILIPTVHILEKGINY